MSEFDFLKLLLQLSGEMSDRPLSGELQKLDVMLTEAGIPFENFGTQICYYGKEGKPEHEMEEGCIWRGRGVDAVCSVISNGYGSREGLLEISGLMTEAEMEETNDTVLGYLTAEDVFARIARHYAE